MEKIALSFTLVWLRLGLLMAQPYAVDVSLQLQAPITPFLEGLTQVTPSPLQLTLLLNDDDEQAYAVRLRFSISGQGISIRTRADVIAPPILLDYGLPVQLMGTDLVDYFLPEQLEIQGIDPVLFLQNGGRLPEGVYNICVEVLDYQRFQGVPISNQSCRVVEMAELAPPQLISPVGDIGVEQVQNLLFQWVPQHLGHFPTNYTLRIWEMGAGLAINQVVQQTLPFFEHQQSGSTTYLYGLDDPPLQMGLSYLVEVQAEDLLMQHAFTNQGRSQVAQFRYGATTITAPDSTPESPCAATFQIEKPIAADFTIRWGSLPGRQTYLLSLATDSLFQEKLPGFSALSTADTFYQLPGLPTEGLVYLQIEGLSSSCPPIKSPPIPLFLGQGCRPLPAGTVEYTCGMVADSTSFTGSTQLIPNLQIEDTLRAHDFQVIIQKVEGRGRFSGEGHVAIPYLEQARVNVVFNNIEVNEYCELVSGKLSVTGTGLAMVSQELAATIDSLISALEILEAGLAEVAAVLEDAADFLQELEGIEGYLANGQQLLENLLHLEQHFPYLPPEVMQAIQDALDCLKSAQSAQDFEDCKAQMLAAIDQLKEALQALYDADFRINFATAQEFGFDTILHPAQAELFDKIPIAGTDYWVPWQSIPSQGTAQVKAWAPAYSTFPEQIQFKNEAQRDIAHTDSAQPNARLLQLTGKGDQQTEMIYALEPYQDSLQQVHIAGQLSLISYDPTPLQVVLVPVNGTLYPYHLDTLRQKLQIIFSQAIVNVELEVHPGLQVSAFDNILDSVSSGFLANYNTEMQLLLNRFKADNSIQGDTYYLFLVQDSEHPQKLGYMPQKKQFGFIYHDNQGTEQQYIKTIAHELAHGAFRLDHSFGDFPSQTDNLMDYALGTHLQKYQWDLIHKPAANWTLFDGDEQGELEMDAVVERVLISRIVGKASPPLDPDFLFISPTGHLITFSGPISHPEYDAVNNADLDPFPKGSLVGFIYDQIQWVAIHEKGTNRFLGYCNNDIYNNVLQGGREPVSLGHLEELDALLKYVHVQPRTTGTVATEILEDCKQKRKTWTAEGSMDFYIGRNCIASIPIPQEAASVNVGTDPGCNILTHTCEGGEMPVEAIPLASSSALVRSVFNTPLENLEQASQASAEDRIFDYTRYQQGIYNTDEILDLAAEFRAHEIVNGSYALMKVYLTDCTTLEERFQEATHSALAPNEWALHLHFVEKEGHYYIIPNIRFGQAVGKGAGGLNKTYQLQAKVFTTLNRLLIDMAPSGEVLLFALKTLSWGAGQTAKLLANDFQIPEKYWKVYLDNGELNPAYSSKYALFFNNFVDYADPSSPVFLLFGRHFDLEQVDEIEQMKFAFFCGMWNQAMEEGANVAQFVELAVDFMLDETVCANVLQALNQLSWEQIVAGLLPNFKAQLGEPHDEIQNSYIAGQNVIIAAIFLIEVADAISGAGAIITAFKKLKDITSASLIKAMIDIRKKLDLRGFRDPDNPHLLVVCATSSGSGIGYQPKDFSNSHPFALWGNAYLGQAFHPIGHLDWLVQCDRRLFRLNQSNGKFHVEKKDINQNLPAAFEVVENFDINANNTEGLPHDIAGDELIVIKDKNGDGHWVVTRSYIRLVEQLKLAFDAPSDLAAKVARLDDANRLVEDVDLRTAIQELEDEQLVFLEDLTKTDNLPTGVEQDKGIGRNISGISGGVVSAWVVLKDGPYKVDIDALTFFSNIQVRAARQTVANYGMTAANPNLFPEEIATIFHYTDDGFEGLNAALRSSNLDKYYNGFNKLLREGLEKLPNYSGTKITRGVYGDEAVLARTWQVGDEIPFSDFKSFSKDDAIAQDFMIANEGDVLYEVLTPTKGKDISSLSSTTIPEAEILYKSGSNFEVQSISDIDVTDFAGNIISVRKVLLIEQ